MTNNSVMEVQVLSCPPIRNLMSFRDCPKTLFSDTPTLTSLPKNLHPPYSAPATQPNGPSLYNRAFFLYFLYVLNQKTDMAAPKKATVKIDDLAKTLDMKPASLRKKINELGFEIGSKEKTIEKDIAELVMTELKPDIAEDDNVDTAEIYDEIVSQQMEREIIKSQRKKTAGKDTKVKTRQEERPLEKPKQIIEIGEVITVKELSEKINVGAAKIIGELMKNGILANLNQSIDYETAAIVAADLGVKIKKKMEAGSAEDMLSGNLENLLSEDEAEDLKERPPVISIMGHVDHGKTKLLDTIRTADVVSTEAGGITQHIGAYQVEKNGKKITFLDTPGHEAFTAMRARGARATDIAILVVAADEGVKPTTIEAINHAKEAGIPIIVAINKIDKSNANPDKVKGELVEYGLQPEEWGGETVMVGVSALTGKGVPELLDMILLVAEMQHLKANPKRPAIGTVIEAHLNPSLGPVATIVINAGTLHIGDNVVVGSASGRIKTMVDDHGKKHKIAYISDPIRISGLSAVPQAGDILQVCKDEKTAKEQAGKISILAMARDHQHRGMGMDEIISRIHKGQLKHLKLVLKVDTKGSMEAIKQSLAKIKDDEVSIKIIHSGIGNITEGDIIMASASKGVIVGFHVAANAQVRAIAERENVDIMKYDIIYKLIDDIKNLLAGLLEPEIVMSEVGEVEIRQIFLTGKKDFIIGCKVRKGVAENKREVKIIRNGNEIGTGRITSLKHNSDAVEEIKENQECGIKLETAIKVEDGDTLIVLRREKKMRTLTL